MLKANRLVNQMKSLVRFTPLNAFSKIQARREAATYNDIYRFPFNNLKNPIKAYVDIKENTLCDNKGARKKAKRIGRGAGSGKGRTSTHGQRGQGQRRNKKFYGFEGGQTPLKRRLPKFGRTKLNQKQISYVNLDRLVYCLKRQWLASSPEKYITIRDLQECGALAKVRYGVKLLSKGSPALEQYGKPVFIEVNEASQSAIDLITKMGGKVRIRYMTPLKLKEHLRSGDFPLPLAEPLPPAYEVMKLEKYRDWGCEVIYRMPRWVEEDLAKGGEHFKGRKKVSYKEVVESSKARVKPILPRQYVFSW